MATPQAPDDLEKDLFLCHSSVDKEWVRTLAADIEAQEWHGRPLTVFLDEWDIPPGGNVVLRINDSLDRARYLGVVLSPETVSSEWCRAEVSTALARDPSNRLGRIIPLRFRDRHQETGCRLEIPPFLQPLNYLDFRAEKDYRRSLDRLLAQLRGESPPRRGTRRPRTSHIASGANEEIVPALPEERHRPDDVSETLVSNLLRIRRSPTAVFGAIATVARKADIPTSVLLPPCLHREGRFLAFEDPTTSEALRNYVTGTSRREAVADWRDTDKWRWFIELLNQSLRQHLAPKGIDYDRAHNRYFVRATATTSLHLNWSGQRRTVVRAPDPGSKGSWVHQAARLRFHSFTTRLYLSIEPTYVFTTDGRTPVAADVAGPLNMQWGGRERNGAIIRHVLMWADILSGGKAEMDIHCGTQSIGITRLPATVRSPVSIADDHVGIASLLRFTESERSLANVRGLTSQASTDVGFVVEDGQAEDDEDEP